MLVVVPHKESSLQFAPLQRTHAEDGTLHDQIGFALCSSEPSFCGAASSSDSKPSVTVPNSRFFPGMSEICPRIPFPGQTRFFLPEIWACVALVGWMRCSTRVGRKKRSHPHYHHRLLLSLSPPHTHNSLAEKRGAWSSSSSSSRSWSSIVGSDDLGREVSKSLALDGDDPIVIGGQGKPPTKMKKNNTEGRGGGREDTLGIQIDDAERIFIGPPPPL